MITSNEQISIPRVLGGREGEKKAYRALVGKPEGKNH
jgi:hypothetical protein